MIVTSRISRVAFALRATAEHGLTRYIRRLVLPCMLTGAHVTLHAAATPPPSAATRPAYVERIPPAEYKEVEALGLRTFSADYELVILKTDGGQATYALGLRKDDKAGFVWDAYFLTPGTKPTAPTIDIEFDPKVARRYLGALNFRLSRWVTVVEKSHKPESYDTAWWIYYKVENGAVTALVNAADFARIPEAEEFSKLFIQAPQRLLLADTAQQPLILEEIETKSAAIVRAELQNTK